MDGQGLGKFSEGRHRHGRKVVGEQEAGSRQGASDRRDRQQGADMGTGSNG